MVDDKFDAICSTSPGSFCANAQSANCRCAPVKERLRSLDPVLGKGGLV